MSSPSVKPECGRATPHQGEYDVCSACRAALAATGGAPRLTWYGPDGERVELSGAVLVNWVTKSTNLLVEECDLEPGSQVALDLPAHWRSAIWAMAIWTCGATVRTGTHERTHGRAEHDDTSADAPARVEAVVTTRPDTWTGAPGRPALVAVELAALARRFGGDLPRGTLDAASGVMTYADVLGPVPTTDPARTALEGPGTRVAHGELLAWALAGPAGTLPDGARTLVVADEPHTFLRDALGTWARGGSVVAVAPSVATLESDEPQRWSRLLAGERVEARVR